MNKYYKICAVRINMNERYYKDTSDIDITFDDIYNKLGLKKPDNEDFVNDNAILILKKILSQYFIETNVSSSVSIHSIKQIITYKTIDGSLEFDLLIVFDYDNKKASIFIDQSNKPNLVKKNIEIALNTLLQ